MARGGGLEERARAGGVAVASREDHPEAERRSRGVAARGERVEERPEREPRVLEARPVVEVDGEPDVLRLGERDRLAAPERLREPLGRVVAAARAPRADD